MFRMIAAGAVCAALLPLSACGGASDAGDTNAQGSSDAVITAYDTEPQGPLIPSNTNERGGSKPNSLIFARLVTFTSEGKPVNEAAESIHANPDSTQYTIKLRPDWKFTDGSAMTASSFTRAWSYAANVTNAQKTASYFSTIKGYDALQTPGVSGDAQLEGLKVIDDRTFTVDLVRPDSVFPIKVGYNAFSPLPESFYKDPKAFGEHPVGNGQYKFKSWEHNKSIQLVRNPDYKGRFKPRNGGVTFMIYTANEAAYADVQAGHLDVMENVPSSASKTFTSDETVQAYNKPGSVIETVDIPSDLEHFKIDQEGILRRQAVSMSIDRDTICRKVLSGTSTAAKGFAAPTIPGYTTDLKNAGNLKYNPRKAKDLWEQANRISPWPSDGHLDFTYNADQNYAPVYRAVANMVKSNLGIQSDDVPIPTFQEFRQNVSERKVGGGFHAGWSPDYPSVENYLKPLYGSAAAHGKGANDNDYSSAEFDGLMEQADKASSPDKVGKYYDQAQGVLLHDLPGMPLYYVNANGVASKRVKDFVISWQNFPVYWQMSVGSDQ
ncbi:peptide ABC transporter substrate-binding protein [Bifidobacterium xylocopae]|uniref:ABC transporter substrate-binding protein n=1 Tax=Bifidobacterium xylocopae TaxID=2493119 RepID=A0A366KBJ9_9BIFI|nr:ABC transporter substrate-binding protein [Bifidobacterium xylocopae]RBP98747.1 ABC transporter substrate-binding protein [Bifidobacterium xylocopae]